MNIITHLLQNRGTLINSIHASEDLKKQCLQLLITSTVAFAAYGFIIGLHQNMLQALSSALKLPILYLITLAICMPAFFIFDSFIGSKASIWQSIALALTATTIISILLIGLAPVTLFFLLTNKNYAFFKTINILFFSISGIAGIRFFYKTILIDSDDKSLQLRRKRFLQVWMILYAFVGTQMAWTLRPFFGASHDKFIFFQEVRGNFYTNLLRTLGDLFK